MLIAALRSFYSYCCAFHKPDSFAVFLLCIVLGFKITKDGQLSVFSIADFLFLYFINQ
jgi:hypothetical protein